MRRTVKRRTVTRAIVPLIALSMIGVACTSSDDDGAEDSTAAGGSASEDTAAPDASAAPAESAAPGDSVEEVQSSGSTLDSVQEAGVFNCGTRDDLPGFATLDAS